MLLCDDNTEMFPHRIGSVTSKIHSASGASDFAARLRLGNYPAELESVVKTDIGKWSKLTKAAKIRID